VIDQRGRQCTIEPAMRALGNIRLPGKQTVLGRRIHTDIKDLFDLGCDRLAALGTIDLCFCHNSLFFNDFLRKARRDNFL
jgi:hypothetical protein